MLSGIFICFITCSCASLIANELSRGGIAHQSLRYTSISDAMEKCVIENKYIINIIMKSSPTWHKHVRPNPVCIYLTVRKEKYAACFGVDLLLNFLDLTLTVCPIKCLFNLLYLPLKQQIEAE